MHACDRERVRGPQSICPPRRRRSAGWLPGWAWAVLLAGGFGCGDAQGTAPPAPGADRGFGTVASAGGPRADAGSPDAGDGSGSAGTDTGEGSAGSALFTRFDCFAVSDDPAADPSIVAPTDFVPRVAFSGWLTDCTTPTFVVGLSAGVCRSGSGCRNGDVFGSATTCLPVDAQRLWLSIEASALSLGTLRPGPNALSVDSGVDGFALDYTRPSTAPPAGAWGNCAGSDGTLFVEALSTGGDAEVALSVSATLTDCTVDPYVAPGADPQVVSGRIDARLTAALSDACP